MDARHTTTYQLANRIDVRSAIGSHKPRRAGTPSRRQLGARKDAGDRTLRYTGDAGWISTHRATTPTPTAAPTDRPHPQTTGRPAEAAQTGSRIATSAA